MRLNHARIEFIRAIRHRVIHKVIVGPERPIDRKETPYIDAIRIVYAT